MPKVTISEQSSLGYGVVEMATDMTAFIGYTEKADDGGKSLINKPKRITSMAEYHSYFGGAPKPVFSIEKVSAKSTDEKDLTIGACKYRLSLVEGNYLLYHSMLLFFSNGGAACCVVSIGSYDDVIGSDAFLAGIEALHDEQEHALLVVPETVLLPSAAESGRVHKAMLRHCDQPIKKRFALLDLWMGHHDGNLPISVCAQSFREHLGDQCLGFGAAYFPWINAMTFRYDELSFEHVANKSTLQGILNAGVSRLQDDLHAANIFRSLVEKVAFEDMQREQKHELHKTLFVLSKEYAMLLLSMKNRLRLLPPGPAVAGLYAMADRSFGVWRTPANIRLRNGLFPAIELGQSQQNELTLPLDGKSVNLIRNTIGDETVLWGARTLDGNSSDWRYINVRRTMIMIERSLEVASQALRYELNEKRTWEMLREMIKGYLTDVWKRGGLAGASPDHAFRVSVGLNETMCQSDLMKGHMIVSVLLALVKPAEYVEFKYWIDMQH